METSAVSEPEKKQIGRGKSPVKNLVEQLFLNLLATMNHDVKNPLPLERKKELR